MLGLEQTQWVWGRAQTLNDFKSSPDDSKCAVWVETISGLTFFLFLKSPVRLVEFVTCFLNACHRCHLGTTVQSFPLFFANIKRTISKSRQYLGTRVKYLLAPQFSLSVMRRREPHVNLTANPSIISLWSDLSFQRLNISLLRWFHLLFYFRRGVWCACHWPRFVPFIRQLRRWPCLP